MRSMQWQLGMLGTILAFAFRHKETEKNLCRDGRLQDLPNTDFQPAVWHLNKKKAMPTLFCVHEILDSNLDLKINYLEEGCDVFLHSL